MDAGAKLTATFGPSGFFLSICSLLTVAFTTQPCVQSVPLAGRTSTGPLRLIASLRATISDDMRSVPAARKRWLTSRLERSGNAIAARTATMANTVTSSTTVKPRILEEIFSMARSSLCMAFSSPAGRGSLVARVIDNQCWTRVPHLDADRGCGQRERRRRAVGSRNNERVLAVEVGRHRRAEIAE